MIRFKITVDKSSNIPVYRQIGDLISGNIENGSLKPGERLPAVRRLAEIAGVTPGTAAAVYRYLENRHIVYTKTGSGTYVAELKMPGSFSSPVSDLNDYEYGDRSMINLSSSNVAEELYPVTEFRRALDIVLREKKGKAFRYENPRGLLSLRQTIGERLGQDPERIQIISGAQQGIDILARAVLSYGDCVFVEKPTYMGAVRAFLSRGAEIVPVEMKDDGMDMKVLEGLLKIYKPRLVYVMTYFQTPTTVSYSIENKRRLLDLSLKYGFYIVEEDNLSNFNYSDKKTVSLKSLDYKNRVIYIKSLSKILMPGLRLGYMVMPRAISENVLGVKYSADMETSGFIQYSFENMLKSGDFDRHTEKIRGFYSRKYELMKRYINMYLKKSCEYKEPEGGLSFWLKQRLGCSERLKKLGAEKGVSISTADSFSFGEEFDSFYRLSFSEASDEDMEKGIKILSEALTNYN